MFKRWKLLILGLLAVITIGGLVWVYYLATDTPVIMVAGKRLDVQWQRVPISELRGPPWGFGLSGHVESRERLVNDGKLSFFRHDLFTLKVPPTVSIPYYTNVTPLTYGSLSADEKRYQIAFGGPGEYDQFSRWRLAKHFDEERRVLEVKIGWTGSAEGQVCSLRFRLTPKGFVLMDEE